MRHSVGVGVVAGLLVLASCGGEKGPGTPVNQAPEIAALPDTAVVVGDTLRLQVEAVDPEGEELRYRLVVAWMAGTGPADAVLDSLSGAFRFIAKSSDRPVRWFIFFARDPVGNESSVNIYVTVVSALTQGERGKVAS